MDKNSINTQYNRNHIVSVKRLVHKYPFEPFCIPNSSSSDEHNATASLLKVAEQIIRKAEENEKADLDSATTKLFLLWQEYKEKSPVFAGLFGEWIFDLYLSVGRETELCSIYEKELCKIPFASDFIIGDYIQSFLEGGKEQNTAKLISAVKRLSEYDFTKSVHYKNDAEIYKKCLCSVIPNVFEYVLLEKGKEFFVPKKKTLKRYAYRGLPCTNGSVKKFEIEYIPYSENDELSSLVSSVIKYVENLIRQGKGVKSKLVGFSLLPEYRRLITETIRSSVPGLLPMPLKVGRKPTGKIKKGIKKQSIEEKTIVFEPIDLNIDFTRAKKLQEESWEIAELFGGDYGENEISYNPENLYDKNKTEDVKSEAFEGTDFDDENIPEEWQEFYLSLTDDEKKMMCCISNGLDVEVFAKKRGGISVGFAESINEKASELYGDIVIDTTEKQLAFIEDYKEELKEIFIEMYKTEVL